MIKAYLFFWKNAFDFKGIAKTGEFWWVVLVEVMLSFGFYYVSNIVGIYAVCAFIPHLSLTIRRLRDVGKTWRTLLWMLVPLIGWLIVFVSLISKSENDRMSEFDRYHW